MTEPWRYGSVREKESSNKFKSNDVLEKINPLI